MIITASDFIGVRRGSAIGPPDYAGLTGVVFHARSEGLVVNTNNSYGVVDASGNVTKLKSVDHLTGHEFDWNTGTPNLTADGISFAAGDRLRHNGLSSAFTPFHYNATLTNLKWTIHAVVKFGTSSNPNAVYGLCGNNAGSSSNRGISLYFDDRAAVPTNNSFSVNVTLNSATFFIVNATNANIMTPNQWTDLWVEVDKSQAQEDQVKLFINGERVIVSNFINSAAPSSAAPSFAMEIGAVGNLALPATMVLKEITFQTGVMSDSFRSTFIRNRMAKYSISSPATVDGIDAEGYWSSINTLNESRYYLQNYLLQKPSNGDTVVSIFSDGTTHFYEAGKKLSKRVSSDRGLTWSSKTTVIDPSGADAVFGSSAGYSSNGRLHLAYDTHTSLAAGSTNKLMYMYSDDDGSTWSTPVEITSSITSDTLLSFRCLSTMIENNGVLMFDLYKFSDEGSAAQSALYVMRSTDGGSTWSCISVKAVSATYINETDLVGLSSTTVLAISRDESTLEWNQFISTDNGLTWTNQGAVTFGETITSASPVRLKKFQISSTDVIACYFSDRDEDVYKAVYAKASDIITNGAAAWTAANKFTIRQGSGEQHLHYGDVLHYNNNFKAICMSALDTWPSTGGTLNSMVTFHLPTFHYSSIKSQLGL